MAKQFIRMNNMDNVLKGVDSAQLQLQKGETDLKTSQTILSAAGRQISACNSIMAYRRLRASKKKIDFLE